MITGLQLIKICPKCGKGFKTTYEDKLYCNARCRRSVQAKRARRRVSETEVEVRDEDPRCHATMTSGEAGLLDIVVENFHKIEKGKFVKLLVEPEKGWQPKIPSVELHEGMNEWFLIRKGDM